MREFPRLSPLAPRSSPGLDPEREAASARVAAAAQDAARLVELDKLDRAAAAPRPLHLQDVAA